MSLAFWTVTYTIKGLTRMMCRVEDSPLAKVPSEGTPNSRLQPHQFHGRTPGIFRTSSHARLPGLQSQRPGTIRFSDHCLTSGELFLFNEGKQI